MTDRQPTQVLANGAIRYGIYRADGTLDHYEYLRREDAPTVEGTPLSKANILSDATASKLWPGSNKPEDPTVNQAFEKLSKGMHLVGDIELTSREAPSSAWLPCDGRFITQAQYPELYPILRAAATSENWSNQVVANTVGYDTAEYNYDMISNANGVWFRARRAEDGVDFYTSANGHSWTKINLPGLSNPSINKYSNVGPVIFVDTKYLCLVQSYNSNSSFYNSHLLQANNPAGPWTKTDMQMAGSPSWDVIRHRLFYLNGVYYTFHSEGGSYSSDLKNWGEFSRPDSNLVIADVALDESTGFFYLIYGASSAYRLIKTTAPANVSDWNYIQQNSYRGNDAQVIADNNMIIVALNYSSKILYSQNGGTSFVTKNMSGAYAVSDLIMFDGFIAGTGASQKVAISDDITTGFVFVDVGYTLSSQLAGHGTLLMGACDSTNTVMRNVYHDYASDSKKIPNITPDARSHAYIKAMEE